MLRLITLAGLTAMALATPIQAASTLEVIITGNGFFPTITYLRPGDTVIFYNEATEDVNVYADGPGHHDHDTLDWSTGDIEPGASRSVLIMNESKLEFEMQGHRWIGGQAQGEGEATVTEGSENGPNGSGYWENYVVQGEFTFDPVRLN